MRYLSLLISILFTINIFAQGLDSSASKESKVIYINHYLVTDPIEIEKPLFANIETLKGNKFEDIDLIKYNYLQNLDIRPEARGDFEWKDLELYRWTKKEAKNGLLTLDDSKNEYEITYAAFYIQNTEWTELELTIKSGQMIEVYLDGEFKISKYSFEKKGKEESVNFKTFIPANNHIVVVKMLNSKEKNDSWTLNCQVSTHNTANTLELLSSTNSGLFMDIDHNMQGVDINTAEISAAGDYYFVHYHIKLAKNEIQTIIEVRESSTDKTIQVYYESDIFALQWSPKGNKLSYMSKVGDRYWILEYNLDLFKSNIIVTDIRQAFDFTWAPNGEYIVLNNNENTEEPMGLYMVDVLSHVKTPLIFGDQDFILQDISPKGRYILFSINSVDEFDSEVTKQIMYQYNTKTNKLETLWNKKGDSRAKYSPNGKQLLVTAGPSFFGNIGVNVKTGDAPNEYDIQAYIYTIKTQSVEAITKDFNPSILEAHWHAMNVNYIYFRVAERSFTNVYQYTIKTKNFDLLPLKIDVINSFSFAKQQPLFIYFGNSVLNSKKLYVAHLELGEIQLIEQPEEQHFKNIKLGKTEEWSFKNKEGNTIEGRIYYPPNFDDTKKYPVIVYYYGGANDSERNFRGGYPINLFAANGYIVYVFQPTGAIGYGQDFSAQYNDWGQKVMDEIIKGSKEVLSSHSSMDASRVGCIGAGYGGYLTMYLINETDIFASAISIAGISSISNYWNDYPQQINHRILLANEYLWKNNKLFEGIALGVDKVSTPILLLKGNTDMDVPKDDIQQFYEALRVKSKEAVLIDLNEKGLTDYEKRVLWQKTIVAYFDKTLKNQPDWWFHLYPKAN